jgi:metaxin
LTAILSSLPASPAPSTTPFSALPPLDVDDIYASALSAFEALSILLGESAWFFSSPQPTLFDAAIFAYTHLLLNERLNWREKKLVRGLRTHANLVAHQERLYQTYWGNLTTKRAKGSE